MQTQTKWIIFFIILLDYTGLNAVSALLPSYLLVPKGLPGMTVWLQVHGAMLIGITIAVYAFGQIIGAFVWGKLSDYFGRRPILQFTVLGNALGLLIAYVGAKTGSIFLLIIGRLVSGLSAGNISVGLSVMSDISSTTQKSVNYRIIQMAIGLGLVLGPAIVAIASSRLFTRNLSPAFPFALLCFLALLTWLFTFVCFNETHQHKGINQKEKITFVLSMPIKYMLIIWAFYIAGLMLFGQFLPSLLTTVFDFNLQSIGFYLGFMGLIYTGFQFFIVKPLSTIFLPARIVKYSLIMVGSCVLLFYFTHGLSELFIISCTYYLFLALLMPYLYTLISDSTSEHLQGNLMGRISAIQGVMTVLTSLLGGILLSVNPKFIVLTAATLIITAWGVLMYNLHHNQEETICN